MLHSSKTTFTKSHKLFLFILVLCLFIITSLGKKKNEIGKCFFLHILISFFTRLALFVSIRQNAPRLAKIPKSVDRRPPSESRVPSDGVSGLVVSVAEGQRYWARTPRVTPGATSNASVRLGRVPSFTSAREGTKQGITHVQRRESILDSGPEQSCSYHRYATSVGHFNSGSACCNV